MESKKTGAWYRSAIFVVSFLLLSAGAQAGTIERLSVDSFGNQADTHSWGPSISNDGRLVVFYSRASNLVPDDTNTGDMFILGYDAFLHDRLTGETSLVSVDSQGEQAAGDCNFASISLNGRYVLFSSSSRLVPDANGRHAYVRDLLKGTTEVVSISSLDGKPRPIGYRQWGRSEQRGLSADGRYAVFTSLSGEFVPGDTNGFADVFLRDRTAGVTTMITTCGDASLQADGDSGAPTISSDGRFVAFMSNAENLVAEDTNGVSDVFVCDIANRTLERVSVGPGGAEADAFSYKPSLSGDGRYVVFESAASNLLKKKDYTLVHDAYLHDRLTGTTELASATSADVQCMSGARPTLSSNGRYVAFHGQCDRESRGIYIRDIVLGTTTPGSQVLPGWDPSISDDAGHVAFTSGGDFLVPGDTNESNDIFYGAKPACPPASYRPVAGSLSIPAVNIAGTSDSYGVEMIRLPKPGKVFRITSLLNAPSDCPGAVFSPDTGVLAIDQVEIMGAALNYGVTMERRPSGRTFDVKTLAK